MCQRMTNEQFGDPHCTRTSTEPPGELDIRPTPPSGGASCPMYGRILLGVAIVVCLVLGVYFKHFHRLPTEDILAANLARQTAAVEDEEDQSFYDVVDEDRDDEVTGDAVTKSRRKWDTWIRRNHFVSIGNLFNKCEGDDRITLGRVVMLEDQKRGGVTSKTYVNVTLEKEIVGGLMYLTCQYNGKDLYSNHWDLCTVEDGHDERVINCPIRAGRRKFVKELKIPNYLPKGRYTSKAWMTDQDKQMIGCAFADFTL